MANTEIRLIIFFAGEDEEALYSQKKTRLGADCGSDHEHLNAKFRLKLKKVGKAIHVWSKSNPLCLYSGSDKQIQGIRLIERVPEELWMEVHDIVQDAVIKTIPKKRNAKRQNGWSSEEALQIAVKRREAKSKGEKERYYHLNAISKEYQGAIRKPSSVINAKK